MRGMRKLRENLPNRVYHLISRVAHRAFFLNAEERTRFVELLKRADASGGGRRIHRAGRQRQPLVVEARVQVDS